ncbi:DUF4845 domain-containing protein [Nitrosomonas eutropha]|uniref:Uncharacterized protein DUF4845 n=2 Tax=Nitrosomonas eutropha TaxID=916 RepID=A0ABX5M4D5_9PROT|nr:DUF4845 domain-containing protein [Nitrosomonas eutropha]ABI60013.1 putative transmembrane protein [Nitrosomonas eutropha C91]PXV77232.1 uncharacterized protein DUF4845 [Nitrosomonas eutropha]SCX24940.1 protein of unknown function [Nitrosomonas eutropha]SDW97630.1 protein of unknown function [Nitrosomonas eutropha]SEI94531.1 protein of unknown function [Nitrosomonas eutropha]
MYSSLYSSTNRGQQGISLPGLLTWSVAIVLAAILGMRLIPSFIEFAAVKRALVTIASDSKLRDASVREIRMAFDKRAAVDDIKSVSGSDIVIRKQDEQLILNISYAVKKPLFANLSLLIDFDAASDQ